MGACRSKRRKARACARVFKEVSPVLVIKFMKGNGTKDLNGNLERTVADIR